MNSKPVPFLRSQTATNRLCGLCFVTFGTTASFFIFASCGDFLALVFETHGFYQKSDSQRETPAKRIAFAEAH